MLGRIDPLRILTLGALGFAVLCASNTLATWAEVVVLSNRTNVSQTFTLLPQGRSSESMTLPVGESRPYFFTGSVRIRFGNGLSRQSFLLSPQSAYCFEQSLADNSLQLEKIGFGPQDYRQLDLHKSGPQEAVEAAVIPVKLLVDDDEPTRRSIWEPRIRQRLEEASQVLELHSGVRFQVVAIETWESDDKVHDFSLSLREFERKVSPQPGQLAIGFSSQYQMVRGRVHMGGTRGVLHPYVLLKERAPRIMETERTELLVHELGHFLGASHSPETLSVMRPLLSKGNQRRLGSRIQFDPANTLLMAMVGNEIRRTGIRSAFDVSRPTRRRMSDIYHVLATAMPQDPAAKLYLKMIGRVNTPPLVEETRLVLRQLVRAASSQSEMSATKTRPAAELTGEELTELYVRKAASYALLVDPARRQQAFLLSLGMFFDDTNTLRSFPLTTQLVRRVEFESERRIRMHVLGQPTMGGRQDLAKHFFVSAHALAAMGSAAARGVGLAKEILDAQQGSGFSFADMAANRAGIVFAEQLLAGNISLDEIVRNFRVADYMPPITDLKEGLGQQELLELLKGKDENQLLAGLKHIERLIQELPVYASPSAKSAP